MGQDKIAGEIIKYLETTDNKYSISKLKSISSAKREIFTCKGLHLRKIKISCQQSNFHLKNKIEQTEPTSYR